jgi:hypothetical protein
MVGDKDEKNQAIHPNFKAYLGRYDGDTHYAEFNMSGYGVGGHQAAGSTWL